MERIWNCGVSGRAARVMARPCRDPGHAVRSRTSAWGELRAPAPWGECGDLHRCGHGGGDGYRRDVRSQASVLHLDLDAFFAAVEQRDKPSLRGKPVVVGGVGGRGVVATASYEARAFGAHSAMPMAQARRRCPLNTAFLSPRFPAYQKTSAVVMELLAGVSPLVEQVSIDEAYIDLATTGADLSIAEVTALARRLKAEIAAATGGVTRSASLRRI